MKFLILAYNVTLLWQPPTEYTDGSPLPAEEIASYIAECYDSAVSVTVGIPGGTTQMFEWLDALAQSGDYACRMQTVASNDEVSDWSNEVSLKLRGTPKPPGLNEAKKKR